MKIRLFEKLALDTTQTAETARIGLKVVFFRETKRGKLGILITMFIIDF